MSRTEEGPRGRFEGRKRTSDTLCDAPCGSREIKCAPTAYIGASPTGTTACGWTMHVRGPHLHIRRVKRSEEHTSELQPRLHLVCRLLLEKKNTTYNRVTAALHEIAAAAGLSHWREGVDYKQRRVYG